MNYTCPMHPEIVSQQPGKCPKCGMALVLKGEIKDRGLGKLTWKNYIPLIAIIGTIFLVSIIFSWRDYAKNAFSISNSTAYFMAGFFLVFGAFKVMDLRGFAHGYATYDILAKRSIVYAFIYPFLELTFGIFMIINYHSIALLWSEFGLMFFSGIGVTRQILKNEQFQCVCLGTLLKVPLTKITLFEDFGMAGLALVLLILL